MWLARRLSRSRVDAAVPARVHAPGIRQLGDALAAEVLARALDAAVAVEVGDEAGSPRPVIFP